jgi:hypothetical protein
MAALTEDQARFVEWTYNGEWHYDERISKWRLDGEEPKTTHELYEFYLDSRC